MNLTEIAERSYMSKGRVSRAEYQSDLSIPTHIGRLLTRVINGRSEQYRLLLNHLVIFFNAFDIKHGSDEYLFANVDRKYHPHLLVMMSKLNLAGRDDVQMNPELEQFERELERSFL